MKHQYFGDINDYRKYGLLRSLSRGGSISISVCWMLTQSDTRADGRFITYLDEPQKWRQYDPELFDLLRQCIRFHNRRDVCEVERREIIRNAVYHSSFLSDDFDARRDFFRHAHIVSGNADLVFFDPDNGLQVNSVKIGSKNSSKFLYWNELEETFRRGPSVLVYQHFPRKKRDVFIYEKLTDLAARLRAREVYAFQTAHVVFFLVPQPRHLAFFQESVAQVQLQWNRQIVVHGPLAMSARLSS